METQSYNNSTEYLKEKYFSQFDDRFRSNLKHVAKSVEKDLFESDFLMNSERSIIFGPIYETQTYKGESLEVLVLITQDNRDENAVDKKYQFFGLDENEYLTVLRNIKITFNSQPEVFAISDIVTGIRGVGLSTALDLCAIDFLQREADKTNKRIVWEVTNFNREILKRMQEGVSQDPASQELPEIENKIAEQSAWKNAWGDGGVLGFQNNRKIFYPSSTKTIDWMTIGKIKVDRHSDDGVNTRIERSLSFLKQDELRKDKKTKIIRAIKKMRELAI